MGKPSLQEQMRVIEALINALKHGSARVSGEGAERVVPCLEATRLELHALATAKVRRTAFVPTIPFKVVDE